jgi:hypothetical protein
VTEVRRLVHRMLAATESPKGSSHV